MGRLRKRWFGMWIASLIFLLFGPVQAEMSCRDKPCCRAETPAAPSTKEVEDECRGCRPSRCRCSLQSSNGGHQQSAPYLSWTFRLESECIERSTPSPLPPSVEPLPTNNLSFDLTGSVLPPSNKHVSYSAFPNPPPAL